MPVCVDQYDMGVGVMPVCVDQYDMGIGVMPVCVDQYGDRCDASMCR